MSVLKTYGVTGLVEWNTVIKAGKARMRVIFTGGALTAYGTTPATFSTRKPLVQNIIEHSDYYKEGRITLISAVGDPDPKPEAAKGGITDTTAHDGGAVDAAREGEASAGSTEGVQEVEVTCLDDAKEYLRENFGVRNIRTNADAVKAAAEHGVVFVGGKF